MLVSCSDISKSYGAQKVLQGVSLQVREGQRAGLVGANGTGKTTLLRIISGGETADVGIVETARGLRIGYLEQEPSLDPVHTVYVAALSAFDELRRIETRLREVEHAMAESDERVRERLAREHGELLEQFERGGGYDHESRTHAVLAGVGFDADALPRAVSKLSGGERSRVALARLLLKDVDVLLLDEPTNHLDLAGVEWLEQFLARSKAGVVVVSHDRLFLDRVATCIFELERTELESYPGNYSRYLEIRAARRKERQRQYAKQQEFIAKEEAFIRRYKAGQRCKEARGRQKRLARVERVDRPVEERDVVIRFEAERASGEVCVRARDLACRFGDRTLFEGLRFELYRGDRMGVVGPNGCGKTSLLRMVLGELAPSTGEVELGHKLKIGYFDQLQAGLDASRSVLDEVWEIRRTLNEVDVRDLLGLFRFSGDDVLKRVGDCSGGERSRVALAKLIVDAPNVLVLDEPTHHLDIPSREALEQALLGYDGTVLAVSHDRFFLNKVVSKLLVFEPEGVRLIHGNYESYEQTRRPEAESQPKATRDAPAKAATPAMSKNRFARLEQQIMALEAERAEVERKLQLPENSTDGDKVRALNLRMREVETRLAELNAQWDLATESI